jgi:FK506-binding protein 1
MDPLWTFVLLAPFVSVLEAGRDFAGEHVANEDPVELDITHLAEDLGRRAKGQFDQAEAWYSSEGAPEDATLMNMVGNFERVSDQAKTAAQNWAHHTYEAMKESQEMLRKPLHDTRDALMRDAKRVNKAINGDFQDHIAMIDNINMDTDKRNKIRAEYGQHVLVPPTDEFETDLVGRRVRCDKVYNGKTKPLGQIIGYDKDKDLFQVQLDHDNSMVLLHNGQFALLPDPSMVKGRYEASAERAERVARRTAELGDLHKNPFVVVDKLEGAPSSEHNTATMAGKESHPVYGIGGGRIWKVLRANEDGSFRVAPPAIAAEQDDSIIGQPGVYKNPKYKYDARAALDLFPGVNFHTFKSIVGDTVRVTYREPDVSEETAKKIDMPAKVVDFNPDKMEYTVSVPDIRVGAENVDRPKSKISANDATGRGAEMFDHPRVMKRVMVKDYNNHWSPGMIMDFQPISASNHDMILGLGDYTYTLKTAAGQTLENKRWQQDWHDMASFETGDIGDIREHFKTASSGSVLQVGAVGRLRLGGNHSKSISRNASPPRGQEVQIKIIKPGDGKTYPKVGDTLTMHYTGTLKDNGQQFDSSRDRGVPFQFRIGTGEVIAGWDEGIMRMSVGEKANLIIPAEKAYGASGAGDAIPPNADLNFEVELLKIN